MFKAFWASGVYLIMMPMLLSEIPGHRSDIMDQPLIYVQPKLDGWRCMANTRTRKIYTRSGRELSTLPHINSALPVDGPEWLDGELYVHGHNVNQIQSMIKKGDSRIQFHIFDMVSPMPFSYRYRAIRSLSERMNTVEAVTVRPQDISAYYEDYLAQGYEGLVIRLDGHPYEHGRSTKIFKMKPGTEVI